MRNEARTSVGFLDAPGAGQACDAQRMSASIRWILVGMACAMAGAACAQGTAFVYQGRLSDNNRPAHGPYDFRVSLFEAVSGGTSVAGPLSFSATGVTNGLFQLSLDFGQGPFSGATRWVEVSVRTNGAVGFSTLSRNDSVGSVVLA